MVPVYYVILIVVLVITTLMIIFHTQIVTWLTPAATWLHGYVYFIHLSTSNVIILQAHSRLAGPNCHIVHYLVSSGKQFCLQTILCNAEANIPLAVWTRNRCRFMWSCLGTWSWFCHRLSWYITW